MSRKKKSPQMTAITILLNRLGWEIFELSVPWRRNLFETYRPDKKITIYTKMLNEEIMKKKIMMCVQIKHTQKKIKKKTKSQMKQKLEATPDYYLFSY